MPMLQDRLERDSPAQDGHEAHSDPIPIQTPPEAQDAHLCRRLSEESIRTELCEGPLPDSPNPRTPERDITHATSDRAELIERLKRGESPTWIPNRHLESLFHSNGPRSPSRSPKHVPSASPTLLPAATIERSSPRVEDIDVEERLQEGLNIERPRSALHSGDFTNNQSPEQSEDQQGQRGLRIQEESRIRPNNHAWIATSPPRHFAPFTFERRTPVSRPRDRALSGASSLSSSFSSSFVYKPPTSPLVQSEINEEVDLSLPMNNIDIASSPRNPRRHTLTSSQSSSFVYSAIQRQPSLRRDGAFPYQAHQPRRSLTSTPSFSFADSSPQTPALLRSRRPSFSSEASPLQHASMVGSYEESILRGRMSTIPSKPLDFLAQIGVLGLGRCKPSLRCPAHVTLPFSAVFYSYSSTPHGRTKDEDGPSPYVGQIDLENGLTNPEEEQRARRKIQSRYSDRRPVEGDIEMEDGTVEGSDLDSRKPLRQKRRSRSPKAPPGGRYRIPEKGQLQIIIKNQNKTAVKLFLVPYDLADMEPGTKTFIRQRSYSAGPIIDSVPDMKDGSAADRPILRYLIHLHICCPSKGRFYLYKSIRVVFANRVPDGKERLRNEVTFPEPRFSPYKPVRVMHPPMAPPNGPAAMLAAEKAIRRRSSGFSLGHFSQPFDGLDMGDILPPLSRSSHHQGASHGFIGHNIPIEPMPFRLPLPRARLQSDVSNGSDATAAQLRSPESSQASRPTTQDSGSQWSSNGLNGQSATYDKLNKGDVGYGGNAFAPTANGGTGAAEGLLSQRLRSLGAQRERPDALLGRGED